MRKRLFLTLFAFSLTLSANELDWVDHQIESIKPPRVGVATSSINALTDPFIFLEAKEKTDLNNVIAPSTNEFTYTNEVQVAPTLRLSAVMNDSALINGKWCKVGEFIHGYKVISINAKSVHLTSKDKKLLLTTQSNSKNLKFKNK